RRSALSTDRLGRSRGRRPRAHRGTSDCEPNGLARCLRAPISREVKSRLPKTRLLIVALSLLVASCGGSARSAPATTTAAPMPSRESGVSTKVVASGSFLPVMPTAVTSFGAASDGRYAYVLGGYFGTPHQYPRAGQSRTISRLPLDGSGRWETIGELPRGVQGLAAVAYDGALCRFGGNEIHGTAER